MGRNAILCRLALAAALAFCLPAAADEFWITAKPFSPEAGVPVELGLSSGTQFRGERMPFSAARTAALQLYSKAAVRDLRGQLPPDSSFDHLSVSFADPGTHMVVYDSEPELATVSADSFRSYLYYEGLEGILRQREQAGTADTPGRERYRRHAKTLLRVGGKSDGTYSLLTGQRLEIVPTADPLSKHAGDTLVFTLYFDSRPLGDTPVKAWHARGGQTVTVRGRTTAGGKAALTLPYAGIWMISALHMTQAADTADADWDSFWANLTFELPPR